MHLYNVNVTAFENYIRLVLILVVMDDALVLGIFAFGVRTFLRVLILVVMDDALVHFQQLRKMNRALVS